MYIVFVIYTCNPPKKQQITEVHWSMLPLNRENPTKNEVFPMVGGSRKLSTELAGFLEINGMCPVRILIHGMIDFLW